MERKILIVLLLFMALAGNARDKEYFALFTDRDLYASGETVFLKVFVPSDEPTGIVTIDLISSVGQAITKIMLEISDHQANGYLYLPDSISSGYYILRTSTRFASVHTIKELYVANRFSGVPEQDELLRPSGELPDPGTKVQSIRINGLDDSYKRRKSVTALLRLPEDLLLQIDGNVHVSISKTNPEYSGKSFILKTKSPPGQIIEKEKIILEGIVQDLKTAQPYKNAVVYLSIPDSVPGLKSSITGPDGRFSFQLNPEYSGRSFSSKTKSPPSQIIEKEGIILEGVVQDMKTSQPFKNAVVYLSIPDSIPGLKYYITGTDGRFYFQLKGCYGKIPIVIQCVDYVSNQLLKISLVDTESLRGGLPLFERKPLPAELRKTISLINDAVTIRKLFNQKEITVQPTPPLKRDLVPFYGTPNSAVYPKLFTDLPDFNEVSRELLPGVKFRTFNRIPSLQVLNNAAHAFFNSPPLVLLDGIPVMDLNVIKGMGSGKIERIDIVTGERFYGDLLLQGVVAIFSAKGNETQVREADDLIKINLDGIEPQATLNIPSDQLSTEPDLRTLLYWEPSVKPKPTIPVDFRTSDLKGSYKLTIRGKTRDGSIFFKEQNFEVN